MSDLERLVSWCPKPNIMAQQTGTGLYSVHQMTASQVRDRVAQAHTMPNVYMTASLCFVGVGMLVF